MESPNAFGGQSITSPLVEIPPLNLEGLSFDLKPKFKVLNDPVHGHFSLPKYCMEVIDTQPFQRLRDLKQLGKHVGLVHQQS